MGKVFFLFISIICITACSSGEIGNSRDVNPETIYISYSVFYREGDDNAECLAQFRFAGEDGTTLVLNAPSFVQFDGHEITVDSNRFIGGAYYRINPDYKNFSGKHEWKYTDAAGKVYSQKFEFAPFSLAGEIKSSVSDNENLEIKFNGIPDGDTVNCIASDTSVNSADINEDFLVNNGAITISSPMLKKLAPGPVNIIISRNYSTGLLQSTPEGGEFRFDYELFPREIYLTKK